MVRRSSSQCWQLLQERTDASHDSASSEDAVWIDADPPHALSLTALGAASGHAAAAPPSSVMTGVALSRHGLLPGTRCASLPRLRMPETPAGPWVDLKCLKSAA